MICSVVLSFYQWDLISPTKSFIGFRNYTDLVSREYFFIATKNTGLYVLGLLLFEMVFPLGLALLISSIVVEKIQTIVKVVVFSPAVISFAVACYVWLWIFNPIFGLLNYFLSIIGISPISWLSQKQWALWSIVLLSGWRQFGYSLILYMAALLAIPPVYLEVARIDGANNWQIFWKIKWPLLSPTTFFILVTTVIFASSHAFIPIHILTQGGPHNVTINLIYLVYQYAFQFFNIGLGSATAVVVFAIFLLVAYIQLRYVERYVYYGV